LVTENSHEKEKRGRDGYLPVKNEKSDLVTEKNLAQPFK